MSNVLEKWLKAQNGELDCWINVKNKILTSDYLEAKKRYYNELLSIIKNFIKKSRSFLDIGCGPSGIFISLLNKDFRRVGIDSLMNDYLKNFPYLSQLGVNWINNSFEGEYFTEKFDTIFILNALDHMQNPEQVIKKISTVLNKNGLLIITLNLHNKKITQRLVEKIHFLDPLHPFQFTLEDINNLLNKYGFKCIFKKRIDYLRIQLEKETAHLNNNPTEVKSNFGLMDILRGIFRKSFFILLEIFGYPRHPKTPEGKSIWAEYLLIFKLSHD